MAVKNCFIRGSVVRYVQLPAEHVDTQLLEDATRRGAPICDLLLVCKSDIPCRGCCNKQAVALCVACLFYRFLPFSRCACAMYSTVSSVHPTRHFMHAVLQPCFRLYHLVFNPSMPRLRTRGYSHQSPMISSPPRIGSRSDSLFCPG